MSDTDTRTKYVKISGRVQGVGFRHFTVKNAERLNLRGWVKNMPDGTVEALISGRKEDVSEMFEKLKKGPVSARVDQIRELPVEDRELPEIFKVKH